MAFVNPEQIKKWLDMGQKKLKKVTHTSNELFAYPNKYLEDLNVKTESYDRELRIKSPRNWTISRRFGWVFTIGVGFPILSWYLIKKDQEWKIKMDKDSYTGLAFRYSERREDGNDGYVYKQNRVPTEIGERKWKATTESLNKQGFFIPKHNLKKE